jgi:hypothetical protein
MNWHTCCGTEFGLDDEFRSHSLLREDWMNRGVPWFFGIVPPDWSGWRQLAKANVLLPYQSEIVFAGAVRPPTTINAGMDQWEAILDVPYPVAA